jgi:hypothetical protein
VIEAKADGPSDSGKVTAVILGIQLLTATGVSVLFLKIPADNDAFFIFLRIGCLGLLWALVLYMLVGSMIEAQKERLGSPSVVMAVCNFVLGYAVFVLLIWFW